MKAWRWSKMELSPIGLDVGARFLRLVQVTTENPPRLAAAASAVIPEELDDDPARRDRFISQTLNELLRAGGFRGRRVVLAIPPARMHVQHLRVANKGDEVVGQDPVYAELHKRLGVDPARLVVRTIEVGQVFTDGAALREVICMATGRNVVMDQIKLAARSRLNAVGVHGQPQAIAVAFAHMFRRKDDAQRSTLFVDIGASMTKTMVLHGKDVAFAKMIHVTADQLAGTQTAAAEGAPEADEPLQEVVAIDQWQEQVGELEVSGGQSRSHSSSPLLTALPPAAETETETVAEPANHEMSDCLIDELQLCLGYHHALYPERPIEKLVFLGGGSEDHDACRRVASALQLPADLGDPLAQLGRLPDAHPPVGLDLRQRQASWACPLGLCLLPADL